MFNCRVIRLFYNFWPEKFGRPFFMQKIIGNAFDPIGIYLIYFIAQLSIDGNANFRNQDQKHIGTIKIFVFEKWKMRNINNINWWFCIYSFVNFSFPFTNENYELCCGQHVFNIASYTNIDTWKWKWKRKCVLDLD